MRNLAAAMAGPAPNTTIPGAAPSVGRLVLLTWTHVAPGEVVTAVSMNAKARLASLLRRPSARQAALAPMAGSFATEASATGSTHNGLGGHCGKRTPGLPQTLLQPPFRIASSLCPLCCYVLSGLTRYAYFPDQCHLQVPQAPARQGHPRSALCLMLRPGIGSHRGLAFVSSRGSCCLNRLWMLPPPVVFTSFIERQ